MCGLFTPIRTYAEWVFLNYKVINMATKIKLGARPKSFTRIVKFPMLEGGEGSIECTFKYRTRSEFGVFIDALLESAGANPKDDGEKFSMAELMERTAGQNAKYIMDVLEGCNLDEDLSQANVQQLADELPGAAAAIMEAYHRLS